MPVISVFSGIIIRMFYREHGVPHFHAEHQGQQSTFTFDGEVLAGGLRSRTALRLIKEWTATHRQRWTLTGIASRWVKRSSGSPRLTEEVVVQFLPMVIRAEFRGGYRIHLTFNDGLENTVDFSHWLDGPVFEPLKDSAYFQRFFVEGGTVAWPNGADVAPETLYERTKSSAAAS